MSLPLRSDVEVALIVGGATRRGRHLRFTCPAHDDRHPSADYDPAQGVWVCRACHVGGGARDLAVRLGVLTPTRPDPPRRPPRVPPPPRGLARAVWAPAWTAIVDRARRQQRRLDPYRDLFTVADWLRRHHQLVADARRVASALGDDPGAWRLLTRAARMATGTAAIEADLDAWRRHVA